MPIVPVDDLDDLRLAGYRNLHEAELQQRADPMHPGGLFIAEGELVVRRLLVSRFPVHSVLVSPVRVRTMRDALEGLPDHVPVYVAPQRLMNAVTGFNIHRGVLALGARPTPVLEDPRELPGDLRHARTVVALEDLTNHDNVGSIFRNVAALAEPGAAGESPDRRAAVLLSPRCADPLYRKSLRVSVGHALSVPFARIAPWPDALNILRRNGLQIIALARNQHATDIARLRLEPGSRVCLVVGSEGPGLAERTVRAADLSVWIPMAEGVDSLNAATAAAVALHALGSSRSQPRNNLAC